MARSPAQEAAAELLEAVRMMGHEQHQHLAGLVLAAREVGGNGQGHYQDRADKAADLADALALVLYRRRRAPALDIIGQAARAAETPGARLTPLGAVMQALPRGIKAEEHPADVRKGPRKGWAVTMRDTKGMVDMLRNEADSESDTITLSSGQPSLFDALIVAGQCWADLKKNQPDLSIYDGAPETP